MSSPCCTDDQMTEIVRFLAWLKKRGAEQRLIYCKKKWESKGIHVKEICKGYARGMMHVQNDPATGEKWVVLDDVVGADKLMMEYGEEVPHHGQWMEL